MAARELISVPVIGIGEATLYTAAMTCSRYSIIASGGKEDIAVFNEIVEKGFDGHHFVAGSDCVILGCGAFAGFGKELTRRTGIMVSDGIKQSVAMARMMYDIKSLDMDRREDKIV